ncbi:MAG: c-type cytochrome [Planctomycetes bacterium]|nr:c-type cytochrome [Planctomycetota bacterium]
MLSDKARLTRVTVVGSLAGFLLLFACAARALNPQPTAAPKTAAVPDQATTSTVTPATSVDSPIVARGQALFARQCAICHGEAGDGAGKFAYLMNPRPRNFKLGKFKLSTTQNQVPSDDDLMRTISRGMPGSAMPPWGHLPIADLQALVQYVRQIWSDAVRADLQSQVAAGELKGDEVSAQLATATTPGAPIVVPPEPKGDDLRWFNGRRVYVEACASCHGQDGHPVAEAVKFDDEGFPDPPRSFVNGIFKGGMDGPGLYARILKGMRGTPMPASEGNYSSDDVWDLIHYVQSLARSGSQDRAQLRQGTISAPKAAGTLPSGPKDPAWNQARATYVAMTPLWWTDHRVEGLVVQAIHNADELAIRLSWLDPSQDDRAVRVDEFRDAVAIQFSMSSDPPFYMGDAQQHGGVNIWMWKADRQKNINEGYQDVDAAFPQRAVDMYDACPIRAKDMSQVDWPHGKITEHFSRYITAWGAGNLVADPNLTTPVECLVARGPGTLAGKPANAQLVKGQAVYERGIWSIQLQRTLELPCHHDQPNAETDERVFRPGDYLPISFAIWDGSAGDRDGKKNISIWQKLVIE